MSLTALAWSMRKDLSIVPFRVLLHLADSADYQGACWITHEEVSQKAGVNEETVVETVGLLEQMGLVSQSVPQVHLNLASTEHEIESFNLSFHSREEAAASRAKYETFDDGE